MGHTLYSHSGQGAAWAVFPDVVRYRGLLFDLVWKDLRVRYRNAMMGLLWAVLQPLLLTLILTFVFTYVIPLYARPAGVPGRHAVSGAAIILCGLIPWQFFSASLSTVTTSLLANRDLIKKVYFPRELIPLASVLNCIVNFIIGFLVLLIVHKALGGPLGWGLLWTPVIFAVQFTLVLGLGLTLSCAEVYYRDTNYIVEIGLVLMFYLTPILYPLSRVASFLVSGSFYYKLYLANPLAGIVAAYRMAVLENQAPEPGLLVWPAIAAAMFLAAGIVFFRRNAPVLADYV